MNMNQLINIDRMHYDLFRFNGAFMSAYKIKGQAYFIGNEIARILGFKNYRGSVHHDVEDDDKLRATMLYAGQNRQVTLISEPGVYDLIFHSRIPSARKFKHWLSHIVLPKLFRNGSYQLPKTPEQKLNYLAVNTSKSIDNLDGRVSNLENNQKIGPDDYGYIGKAVGHKVYGYEKDHHLLLTNKERSKLYKDINGGVKKITGARCRSQLKAKDFDKVCDYIDRWIPSTATLTIIKAMKDGE